MRAGQRPSTDEPWPPRLLLVGASPGRAGVRWPGRPPARASASCSSYAPRLDDARLARAGAGAQAAVLPVVSDSAGLPGDRGDRRGDAGRRLRRSGRCPRWSALPGSSSSPRRRTGSPGDRARRRALFARNARAPGTGDDEGRTSGRRRPARCARSTRTRGRHAAETRAVYVEAAARAACRRRRVRRAAVPGLILTRSRSGRPG